MFFVSLTQDPEQLPLYSEWRAAALCVHQFGQSSAFDTLAFRKTYRLFSHKF